MYIIQYNGASIVDYCVVSCSLLNYVRYFKVSDLTPYSDHSQITACFALNHIEGKFKTNRPEPNTIKWNPYNISEICGNNKSKKNKPWFDRDCSALKRSIRDLASRISNMQTNNELIKHYYNEKKRYKTLIRKKSTDSIKQRY